jgi:hypothetical protein
LIGFLLGGLALLVKKGSSILALVAGILMFPGVLIAGYTRAPEVLTTWGGGIGNIYNLYGTGGPLLGLGFWAAIVVSVVLFMISLAEFKLRKQKAT